MRLCILLALALLAGCATPADEPTPAPTVDPTSEPGGTELVITPIEARVALVERPAVGVPPTTLAIEPARVEVKEDQRVKLVVSNEGNGPHNLVIEGLDVETETLEAGATTELEFVAQDRGTYRMYCSIGGSGPSGHDAQGMRGEFAVS